MSKNWYPIINYEKCVGCLECVKFCPHGVLEEVDGKPQVVNPQACIEFCRGCQKGACDYNAIAFPGDKEEIKNE